MASAIRGVFFFFIGLVVYFYSLFIESHSSANLVFFKVVALLFIVYGVFKETLFFMRVRSNNKINKSVSQNHNINSHPANKINNLNNLKNQFSHQHFSNHHASFPHPKAHYKRCPHCHRLVPSNSVVCPFCHYRIN